MGQNSIISPFFDRRAKKALGRSPPQELGVGPLSGPYLLVAIMQERLQNNLFEIECMEDCIYVEALYVYIAS